mgnify:FL=1
MLKSIKEFLRVIGEIRYIVPLLRYKWPDPDDNASLAHSFEQSVEKYKNKDFIFFEDQTWTYSEINNTANILAHKLIEDGISHGDKVILFMENLSLIHI